MSTDLTLEQGKKIAAALRAFTDEAVAAASKRTEGGKRIDEHQVHAERIAQLATELRAVEEFLAYAERIAGEGNADPHVESMAIAFAGDVAAKSLAGASAALEDYGIGEDALAKTIGGAEIRRLSRDAMHESRYRAIGRKVAEQGGENNIWLGDDILTATRESVCAASPATRWRPAPRSSTATTTSSPTS